MYVHGFARSDALQGLSGLGDLYTLAQQAGLDPKSASYYAQGQWSGDDPIQCIARGGLVNAQFRDPVGQFDMSQPHAYFYCRLPAAPAYTPTAAPVTVSTSVQSAVSPQISPGLTQQQSPTGSPVNTGIAQTSPAPQTSTTGAQSPDFQAYLDKQAADEKAFLDMLAQNASSGASYSTPSTAYASPVPDAGPLQAGSPQIAVPSKLAQYTPWIVFATALAGLAAVMHRDKPARGARSQRG